MDKPPVILLSGIRWDFLWQRHQTLTTLFARAGYPTVFVETTGFANPCPGRDTLRKVADRIRRAGRADRVDLENRLTIYTPLTAPPTNKLFQWINSKLFAPRVVRDLLSITGLDPIVVAYPPTQTTLDLISGLRPRLLLYDCSDDYEEFTGVPDDIAKTEGELIRRADLVSCTSTRLLQKTRSIRPDAFLSGPGVEYERFSGLQGERPKDIRTVCFFGHLSRERIDLPALISMAGAGFKVRLVGGLGRLEKSFLETPGIDYRGEVPHAELPAALEGVDAFVFPYLVNGLTRGISPAKTYECMATGKPVVSAPLPAMTELREYVYLAGKPEEYVKALRGLLEIETEEKIQARIDIARRNSWERRFEELERRLWSRL